MDTAGPALAADPDGSPGYSLRRLHRQFSDFSASKTAEGKEAKIARRYYHGAQWDQSEVAVLAERKQPVVTFNRIARKIDGFVGLIERLRQDPKAFPRTPIHEQGAELATAVLNYVLDAAQWRDMSPQTAHDGAVEGVGGVEVSLEWLPDGSVGEIGLDRIDPIDFFYDPRSIRADFSDARYMGLAKWLDIEAAIELFPEFEDELRDYVGTGSGDFGNMGDERSSERTIRWVNSSEKRVRLVEHWYKDRGEWHVCFYAGSVELLKGQSPFFDHKGKTFCRLIMYSNGVDHDGDRYGFFRNLKSPQDELNARRSKGLHLMNTRRVILEEGAVDDIEKTRREAARSDGVIVVRPGMRFEFDDVARQNQAQANLALEQEAKAEIETFGPNPALLGESSGDKSGRAIALLQQAGIAELGPYILRYRGWKIRLYRAIWSIVQKYWTSERYIRVTDDEEKVQFLQINGQEVDPMTGEVRGVNMIGDLDVDIILDEGPDQVNSMADAFDTLIALSQRGAQVPPEVILELSSLPGNLKKRIIDRMEQAQQAAQAVSPIQEKAAQLQLENQAADVRKKLAVARKDEVSAVEIGVRAGVQAAPYTGRAPLAPEPAPMAAGPAL